MKTFSMSVRSGVAMLCAAILAVAVGCEGNPATQPAPALAAPTAITRPTIRINAGAEADFKDAQGNTWSADTGFDEGMTVDRPDLPITGTNTPELYRTERYSMNAYSMKVPNGNYLVKLHFSEDFDGLTEPDQRMFTYAVKDGDAATGKTIKEVKNFSPWKAAGAQFKAYIDTVPVTVTKERITITFTPEVENPQINALEIIPQ